jgi:hypothetical protein
MLSQSVEIAQRSKTVIRPQIEKGSALLNADIIIALN